MVLLLNAGYGSADAAPRRPAKAKAAPKAEAAPPAASAEEIDKLKGEFKWGMSVEDVTNKVVERLEASYEERLKKSATDPARNDRVRKEMRTEIEKAKKNHVTFEGGKSGYDVSIIDQEFAHNTGESMLVAKEENSTRYFFFSDGRLYKMFIAFDKEMLAGKSFEEFGELMQARFGKAKVVTVDVTERGQVVKKKLDHFEWGSKAGDGLRLVDRSEFYDVYCLVVYDNAVSTRLADLRKIKNPKQERRDALVEAVTNGTSSPNDENDNVVDRIVGKDMLKPGERRGGDIVVPSPTGKPAGGDAKSRGKARGKGGETDGMQL
jgi:hypothetical protein